MLCLLRLACLDLALRDVRGPPFQGAGEGLLCLVVVRVMLVSMISYLLAMLAADARASSASSEGLARPAPNNKKAHTSEETAKTDDLRRTICAPELVPFRPKSDDLGVQSSKADDLKRVSCAGEIVSFLSFLFEMVRFRWKSDDLCCTVCAGEMV